ncbi:photosystem II protein Y [Oxynema sp. CENA135]|jgi:photosystem II PsbY protein|uniref:Photosystem II reaction center protein Y n=1 Tax=Oxynema aestuarii AP17 TaxID=2064643 RepID=A0A6H1TW80_9CYAN|nr:MULTISPECIES: photosystem II protein Y [Oxynema]MBK4728900.1 photosystem II protein Y [Oxynema sp. CENA135]QIZ70456.1 photosystem II protein Y [Oxynema aestuarii AP17]RMH75878.1 MAG: photosystem II protein Y [Cyanobacteria bacterium J007]
MDLDLRLLIVLLPVLAAGGWAFYNVGKVALQQLQNFLNKEA